MEPETNTSETKTPATMEMETTGGDHEVLSAGPRPGKAICSFWQGRVEIALRIMAVMVGSLPALITAIIGIKLLLGSSPGYSGFLALILAMIIIPIVGSAIIKEIVMIILRLCNCGCVNRSINAILITAVIFSFIFSFLHLSGVVMAIFSALFSRIEARVFFSLCAFFCLLAAILYVVQASWSITFLVKKWNKNVDEYTLRNMATNYTNIHN